MLRCPDRFSNAFWHVPKRTNSPDSPLARNDRVLWAILVVALVSRMSFAACAPAGYCELVVFIPAAERISLEPGHVYLPVRDIRTRPCPPT